MTPQVTGFSNGSPVSPSYRVILELDGRSAWDSLPSIISFDADWNTGVAYHSSSLSPAQPSWVSMIWPRFIRDGTPSGFSTTSTEVPSAMNGMSSSGSTRAITPLLPWRPAILSPSCSLRLDATST